MSTIITTADDFMNQFEELLSDKENPDEWYVLVGSPVTDYSVNIADVPDELQELDRKELPPEERDATENVPGSFQIGVAGWGEQMFDDDPNFVMEYQNAPFGNIDSRLLYTLLVHESVLNEDALAVANGEKEPEVLNANG